MKITRALAAFLFAFAIAPSSQATVVLSLVPSSGTLSGLAGSVIGWGFALTNTTDFAVVTSSNFCFSASGVNSACVSPTLGAYTDYIASNFVIVGPSPESPTIIEAFDSGQITGIGQFTISNSSALGATDHGQIVLTYDLYSVDPLSAVFDPVADLISAGNYLSEPAAITISGAPEPDVRRLLASALGILIALRIARRVTTNWLNSTRRGTATDGGNGM